MNDYKIKKALTIVSAIMLSNSIASACDVTQDPELKLEVPVRNKPFRPLEEIESTSPSGQIMQEHLNALIKDPTYIHTLFNQVLTTVSKADRISDSDVSYEKIISNKAKVDAFLGKLNGNAPTPDDINGSEEEKFFRHPTKKDEKDTDTPAAIRFKRTALAALMRQNIGMLATDPQIGEKVASSVKNAVIYNHHSELDISPKTPVNTVISVPQSNSIQEALNYPGKNVTVLLFSDAENVGGGHPDGVGGTQEEAIFYASPKLSPVATILAAAGGYPIPPMGVISIPSVEIERDPAHNMLEQKIVVNYVFSHAYDLRNAIEEATYKKGVPEKLEMVFKAVVALKTDIFIAGAWGCGVFKNNPDFIVENFQNFLKIYGGYFEKVVFPIPEGTEPTRKNFSGIDVDNPNKVFALLANDR